MKWTALRQPRWTPKNLICYASNVNVHFLQDKQFHVSKDVEHFCVALDVDTRMAVTAKEELKQK